MPEVEACELEEGEEDAQGPAAPADGGTPNDNFFFSSAILGLVHTRFMPRTK